MYIYVNNLDPYLYAGMATRGRLPTLLLRSHIFIGPYHSIQDIIYLTEADLTYSIYTKAPPCFLIS